MSLSLLPRLDDNHLLRDLVLGVSAAGQAVAEVLATVHAAAATSANNTGEAGD